MTRIIIDETASMKTKSGFKFLPLGYDESVQKVVIRLSNDNRQFSCEILVLKDFPFIISQFTEYEPAPSEKNPIKL